VVGVPAVVCSIAALVVFVGCMAHGFSTSPSDPHHHAVPVHDTPWMTDLAPEVSIVAVADGVAGSDFVFSPDAKWRAYIVQSGDEPGGRVRFEMVGDEATYEVRGLPLPQRPLSGLTWLDADRLTFDRWSQPHHGIHYVVDVRRRRLELAAPFPDWASPRG